MERLLAAGENDRQEPRMEGPSAAAGKTRFGGDFLASWVSPGSSKFQTGCTDTTR